LSRATVFFAKKQKKTQQKRMKLGFENQQGSASGAARIIRREITGARRFHYFFDCNGGYG
jgi:hypothetical protein